MNRITSNLSICAAAGCGMPIYPHHTFCTDHAPTPTQIPQLARQAVAAGFVLYRAPNGREYVMTPDATESYEIWRGAATGHHYCRCEIGGAGELCPHLALYYQQQVPA